MYYIIKCLYFARIIALSPSSPYKIYIISLISPTPPLSPPGLPCPVQVHGSARTQESSSQAPCPLCSTTTPSMPPSPTPVGTASTCTVPPPSPVWRAASGHTPSPPVCPNRSSVVEKMHGGVMKGKKRTGLGYCGVRLGYG